MDESTPLIADQNAVGQKEAPQTKLLAAAMGGDGERDWDGHLLKLCGNCDQNGVSTYALVKWLGPIAWRHNIKRAFGTAHWRRKRFEHIIVSCILIFIWTAYLHGGAVPEFESCGPQYPTPQSQMVQEFHFGVEGGKDILPGSTLDPELSKQMPGGDLDWVDLETDEIIDDKVIVEDFRFEAAQPLNDLDAEKQEIQNQVQDAKLQAAESMAMLGTGRKMLHKHKHDHDDDDDDHKKGGHKHHDDDDDDDDDDDEDEKKNDKHKEKHSKDQKTDRKFLDPLNNPVAKTHGAPGDRSETAECRKRNDLIGLGLVLLITSAIIVVYGCEARTAMRKRFGIKGNHVKDCLAWTFCAPCALCQESRTLVKYNVHDGEWYGETMLLQSTTQSHPLQVPPPVTTAPVVTAAPTKPV